MRRFLIAATAVFFSLGFAASAANVFYEAGQSGPRNMGLRASIGVYDFVYQYNMKDAQFLDTSMGIIDDGVSLSASYNFTVYSPDWTSKGRWGIYAGPGLAIGIVNDTANIGIIANVGLEYSLDGVPVTFSVDVRPEYELTGRGNFIPKTWIPALGIKYRF